MLLRVLFVLTRHVCTHSCPFGAVCGGANDVVAQPGYWGWKSSDTVLHSPFVRLPPGFSCTKTCGSITSCGGNRNDVLCGGCKTNFSFAFFDKSCVPDSQCAGWKYGPLVVGAFLYAFLFSVYLIYSNEVSAREISTSNQGVPEALTAERGIAAFADLGPSTKTKKLVSHTSRIAAASVSSPHPQFSRPNRSNMANQTKVLALQSAESPSVHRPGTTASSPNSKPDTTAESPFPVLM